MLSLTPTFRVPIYLGTYYSCALHFHAEQITKGCTCSPFIDHSLGILHTSASSSRPFSVMCRLREPALQLLLESFSLNQRYLVCDDYVDASV